MNQSTPGVSTSSDEDDHKQHLDRELSEVVAKYESRGMSASEIVDSMLWHAEVAVSRAERGVSVGEYVRE